MNTDIRLDVTLLAHRKYLRLKRRVGPGALEHLVAWWVQVAHQCPDGRLKGWTGEDLADAAGWAGEPAEWVEHLTACGWLDGKETAWRVHDWEEHQPWVASAPERQERARNAGLASAAAREARRAEDRPREGPPTKRRLRELARGELAPILSALANGGRYKPPKIQNPITAAALKAVGGFSALCDATPHDLEKLKATFAGRWVEAWQARAAGPDGG